MKNLIPILSHIRHMIIIITVVCVTLPLPSYAANPSRRPQSGVALNTSNIGSTQQESLLQVERTSPENLVQSLAYNAPASEADHTSTNIKLLAEALKNDPKALFDYVHNTIDYVPTYGCMKDADTTLLIKRGNDCEQASLFIALMRAAGYTATYVIGEGDYTFDILDNWVGAENALSRNVFSNGGIPITMIPGGARLTRFWVEANINGTSYTFDPAMKTYRTITGKANLTSLMQYDQTTFLAHALDGATKTADYVQAMNDTKIRVDMTTYGTNLLTKMRSDYPNDSLSDLISGREIVAEQMNNYATTLPKATNLTTTTTLPTLTESYRHTVSITYRNITHTFNSYEITGRRVTLFHQKINDTTYRPELRVDGELLKTWDDVAAGSAKASLDVTIQHPYTTMSNKQTASFSLALEGSYLIMHDFDEGEEAMTNRFREQLDQAIASGNPALSEPVHGNIWEYCQMKPRLHTSCLLHRLPPPYTQRQRLTTSSTRVPMAEQYGPPCPVWIQLRPRSNG